jgi:hypothetical protein
MLLLCSTITIGKQVDGKCSRFEINSTKYLIDRFSAILNLCILYDFLRCMKLHFQLGNYSDGF